MKITLIFFTENKKTDTLEFEKNALSIGRSTECDVTISDSMVSSVHFKIYKKDDKLLIEDNKSLNGTFLNGAPVNNPLPMPRTGIITFCSHKIEYKVEGVMAEPAAFEPKLTDKGNATIILQKEYLNGLTEEKKLFRPLNIAIAASVIFVLSIVLIFLMTSQQDSTPKNPFKAQMLDSYFVTLDLKISEGITNNENPEEGEKLYQLGVKKLELINLNHESEYEALIYFIKARQSMIGITPKPQLLDKINPAISKAKRNIKNNIKILFQEGWLAEKKGDKILAKDKYNTILQSLPDEGSDIFIMATQRKNRL